MFLAVRQPFLSETEAVQSVLSPILLSKTSLTKSQILGMRRGEFTVYAASASCLFVLLFDLGVLKGHLGSKKSLYDKKTD